MSNLVPLEGLLAGILDLSGDMKYNEVAICHTPRTLKTTNEKALEMTTAKNEARLNFRLSPDLKQTIEEAAAQLGQTVSDFAVSTLVQTARRVIQEQNVTTLSQRDREAFVKILDEKTAKPNKALAAAAKRYKKRVE